MRRRNLTQIAAAGALLGMAAAALGVVKLRRYVDQDPGFCAHCHKTSPEFALWSSGGHRGVACQRCHHSTPAQGVAMLRAFVAGRSPGGKQKHAEVEIGACAACHLSHDARWPQIEASRGHRVHVNEKKIACVSCHAQAMHGFAPPVEACRSCHGEHVVRAVGMQKLHCFACHEFLSQEPGLRPTRADCLKCHRDNAVHPARFSASAPMQFDCAACHHPHARTLEQERLPCMGCHPGVPRAGLHAAPGHRACAECHKAHLWKSGDQSCRRCHAEVAHGEGKACATCHGFHGAGEPVAPPRAGGAP